MIQQPKSSNVEELSFSSRIEGLELTLGFYNLHISYLAGKLISISNMADAGVQTMLEKET